MQLLRNFIIRLEVISFFLGFVVALYGLIFYPMKYLAWHRLPAPPERVIKIFGVDHLGKIIVTTDSNKKFVCDLENEKDCWTEVDYQPYALGTLQCYKDCRDKHIVQIISATGQFHNFGALSHIYSLHDDGSIFVKETGAIYLPGYVLGGIAGGICALIAFIGKRLLMTIISLFEKGQTFIAC